MDRRRVVPRWGALVAATLVAALVLLLPASPAAACSCGMPEPVEPATLEEYDVAFTGEVTGNEADDQMARRELVVAVDQVFKGTAEADQLVVTHAQSSACGTDPAVGSEVLFLTTRGPQSSMDDFAEPDELVVMSCGGDRSVDEAVALGEGRPPDEAAAPEPRTPGTGETTDPDLETGTFLAIVAAIVLVTGGVVAAVVIVVRRRRAAGGGPA